MIHQVLARKWRPHNLEEVVGQASILQTLRNALDQQRLHHAYLFTGTRGVGKTSLARILAKCLNCEVGVSSTPCNQCDNCRDIDQGRFIDLLEIDAASRTKVEDTRELLENVQYQPTRGRFKIYLIDEVHMLSQHSFNALLKTLEEPPSHVKFLFATTDPERLPATILSRCLQLHLKNMLPEQIATHLASILEQENITFEMSALQQLGQAAAGSLRDALSLLDQAIAYGSGHISIQNVRHLLGTTDPEHITHLVTALADRDGKTLMTVIDALAEYATDFEQILIDLLSFLQRIAIAQLIPERNADPIFMHLATRFNKEEIQLYYQIALIGRRDLPLAPDPRLGFEMILLRMLAFQPMQAQGTQTTSNSISTQTTMTSEMTTSASSRPTTSAVSSHHTDDTWTMLLSKLNLTGVSHAIAMHSVLEKMTETHITLMLDSSHATLFNQKHQQRIQEAIIQHLDRPIQLQIAIGTPTLATPAKQQQQHEQKQQENARAAFEKDDTLQSLIKAFDARLDPNSIVPLE